MKNPVDETYIKYRKLIKSLAKSIAVNNSSVVDLQDLYQAGALGLIVAIQTYNSSMGSFPAYVRKVIRRSLLEQANSFSGVFTVDEKVRRQANALVKMRKRGIDDHSIMTKLGIRTQSTFLALLNLVESCVVDINQANVPVINDEVPISKILDEIDLTDQEWAFIDLVVNNYSIKDIKRIMNITRSELYDIKSSIQDKIMEWGRDG